ncbi:unnamed protein product [Echinostoma caproni]|uniref:SLC12 domain-containing protein n=1 Tax=Echinostoma caproni TaxID=27848 RepID=A0A183AQV8_9TREM|nr:unnamed protein product [Echinostoma caproni]
MLHKCAANTEFELIGYGAPCTITEMLLTNECGSVLLSKINPLNTPFDMGLLSSALMLVCEWGDATRGLQMSTAKRAILKLGTKPIHAKNWRPQILVYIQLDNELQVLHDRLLDLAYQLKAGHGLTLIAAILEGDILERREDANTAKAKLSELIQQYRIKGLAEVLVSSSVGEGMRNMAQCAGLGNLRHNTIMVSFPEDWRADCERNGQKLHQFLSTVKAAQACDVAMIVPKGIDSFPKSKATQMQGSVDVWCIVHDGGLLLLTSYLLMRNRVWRQCQLRVFVVANETDDTVSLKRDMTKFMYDLRINAEVEVVALSTDDISAYVAQRTANIEQRRLMLMQMKLKNTEARLDPQHIVDQHRKSLASNDLAASVDALKAAEAPKRKKKGSIFGSGFQFLSGKDQDASEEHANGRTPDSGLTNSTSDDVHRDLLAADRAPGKPAEEGIQHQCSVSFAAGPGPAAAAREKGDANGLESAEDGQNRKMNEFTFSPSHPLAAAARKAVGENAAGKNHVNPHTPSRMSENQRKLHSATRLNELLQNHSSEAALVIVNMPTPSRSEASEYYYMDYIEVLTEGLSRVLLVRGTGREVITAFSE